MAVLDTYTWIIAVISVAFCFSAFGNGANDVANSYATSVAAQSLSMVQVGILATFTEFLGAVVLGGKVTKTIKSGIIDIDRFERKPATLILGMGCAEIASATWLMIASKFGLPVSTTQTVVGALIGVGIASRTRVHWNWQSGSPSQIAASWGIAPLVSGGISSVIMLILHYTILRSDNSFNRAFHLMPLVLAITAGILTVFITIEAPGHPLYSWSAGKGVGIILGVLVGTLLLAYGFFYPYTYRRLLKEDGRVRFRHIFLGPHLWKEDPWLYFPGDPDDVSLKNHYAGADEANALGTVGTLRGESKLGSGTTATNIDHSGTNMGLPLPNQDPISTEPFPPLVSNETQTNDSTIADPTIKTSTNASTTIAVTSARTSDTSDLEKGKLPLPGNPIRLKIIEPEERYLTPTKNLKWWNRHRLWAYTKYWLLQGVTRDCVTHCSVSLAKTHAEARRYDNRVEHLFTYAQVASAIMMSIAHGSNDVANAVGPWVGAYTTYKSGLVEPEAHTPIWILAVAGTLIGAGFWFFGWRIIRSMGNKITQMTPVRGFSVELGAAITVMLASKYGLPVSTTQCVAGSTVGVALVNKSWKAVNWKQLLFIFSGWVYTLPAAGMMGGLLMGMALNTPHF